jgi:hypothetical protein
MKRALLAPTQSSIEILEGRIAPAAVFTFTDIDGDTVKITSSKGTVADLQAALNPLPVDSTTPTQILSLNLGAVFKGADISIVAGASTTDAAFVNIGFINAAGIDLGKVTVDGDLNRIVAGDGNSKTAGLRALTVNSFGKFDVTPGDQAGEFDSKITGALPSLRVVGDMQGAFIKVIGSDSETAQNPVTDRDGKIGKVFIGGSLIGTARENGGAIYATGDIGKIDVIGNITGFTGANARVADGQDHNASIISDGGLGVITIGGNLTGGDGDFTGHITSGAGIKAFSVKNLIGGYGEESGVVGSSSSLGKVTIAESVIGSDGYRSGSILSQANMQAVSVGLKLEGGGGESSGWIAAGGTLTSVTIGKNLPAESDAVIGGGGEFSGSVGARGSVGAVQVFGNLVGGYGPSSGQVVSQGTIKSVTIEGDLVGGDDFESGAIGSLRGLGPILIKGSIIAGSGERSGLITTQKAFYREGDTFFAAPIASVTVLGSIDGGGQIPDVFQDGPVALANSSAGPFAAGIIASGNLGPVLVRGSVTGGDGYSSGRISATGEMKSVTIEGSLSGGDGNGSGTITSSGALGPVSIGEKTLGNVEGGFGDFSGVIFSGVKIAKVTIGGNLFGGYGYSSGVIETSNESSNGADIGAIFIGGSIVGGSDGARSGSIFSAGKIASITVGDPKIPVETEGGGRAVAFDGPVTTGNGSLIGGFADQSGSIYSKSDIGPITIKYNIEGGTGANSGRIFTGGKLTSLAVGLATQGSITGGIGEQGDGYEDGQIYARETITKVEIGGSLEGAEGNNTGQIRGRSIGSVIIGDSIYGGAGEASGSIFSYSLDIGSVKLGYSLVAGTGERAGWIAAQRNLGSVEAEYISGSGTARAKISAGEKIDSVTVRNTISFSSIYAGYGIDGHGFNPDAQIGTIKVLGYKSSGEFYGGNLINVNIGAGVTTGYGGPFGQGDGVLGTSDDSVISSPNDNPKIHSKIAKIIIGGDVLQGSSGPGIPTHYGIVAQEIGSLTVGGVARALKAGPSNDPLSAGLLVGSATNVTYGEVGSSVIASPTPPVVIDQFNPALGQLVSAAFDSTTGNVWIYGASAADVRSYTATGSFLSLVTRPGESANDVDIEFAPVALTLGNTPIPAGTLLFINGETGPAEIYAVDKTSGTILATLNTSFGASHVVGGAYHPGRGTFFLVQDQVPGGTEANRIAEIDPLTGNVLNSFQTTGVFSVNFGDLDVSTTTGNLFVVSSIESRVAELTPTGTLVRYLPLPAGVSSLSGIGFDDAQGQAWVSSTNGTVHRLGNIP